MKQLCTIILILCTVLSFVACTPLAEDTTVATTETTAPEETTVLSEDSTTSEADTETSQQDETTTFSETTEITTTQSPEDTTMEPTCEHIFTDATCTSPATCTLCGETTGEKLEHDYTEPGCTSRATCRNCGKERGGTLGHNYQAGACIRCGKEDPYIRVSCIGDSITAGGYWRLMGNYLGSTYSVEGFGASGTTGLASGLDGYPNPVPLAYIDQEAHQNALRRDAQIVVIMLGTNDSKPMNANQIKADNGEQYKADMIALVRAYQDIESHPQVFLALPPVSYRPETEHGMSNVNIEQLIIPILMEVAEETGALVIDTHTATQNQSEAFPDGVHPNDVGKDLLAKTIAEAILAAREPADEE